MKRKLALLLFPIIFQPALSSENFLFAQAETVILRDSSNFEEIPMYEGNFDDDDFEPVPQSGKKKRFNLGSPIFEFSYGPSTGSWNNFSGEFSNVQSFEIAVGTSRQSRLRRDTNVAKFSDSRLFAGQTGGKISPEIAPVQKKNNFSIWRFGLDSKAGYEYRPSGFLYSIRPYYGSGIVWSYFNTDFVEGSDATANPLDSASLARVREYDRKISLYDEEIRFGTHGIGGIQLQFSQMIALDLGYQRAVIFQRHMFWKWLGSELIEGLGSGAIDIFVSRVARSSPKAAPILSFLLHNGLNYGIYELRRSKMNWPFSSEPPLSFDSYRVGLTFTF